MFMGVLCSDWVYIRVSWDDNLIRNISTTSCRLIECWSLIGWPTILSDKFHRHLVLNVWRVHDLDKLLKGDESVLQCNHDHGHCNQKSINLHCVFKSLKGDGSFLQTFIEFKMSITIIRIIATIIIIIIVKPQYSSQLSWSLRPPRLSKPPCLGNGHQIIT